MYIITLFTHLILSTIREINILSDISLTSWCLLETAVFITGSLEKWCSTATHPPELFIFCVNIGVYPYKPLSIYSIKRKHMTHVSDGDAVDAFSFFSPLLQHVSFKDSARRGPAHLARSSSVSGRLLSVGDSHHEDRLRKYYVHRVLRGLGSPACARLTLYLCGTVEACCPDAFSNSKLEWF